MPDTIIVSKNGVPIRFPNERWLHIIDEQNEISALRADAPPR